jgi:hypothetical protein
MSRRAHRNKNSSPSNTVSQNVSKSSSKKAAVAPKPVEPTPKPVKLAPKPVEPTVASKPVVEEPPLEIFYMTENGIDLKAMYPDIQLFENAIKYGVGSWYDLGEKLTRLERSAPKRNVRIIETTEAELRLIRIKEYVDKFVRHIEKMPEEKRTFNALVTLVSNNIDQVPEKYKDDVLESVCKIIEDNKMYIDKPPMREMPQPEPVAAPAATSYVLVPLQIVQPHIVCEEQAAACTPPATDDDSYDEYETAHEPSLYEIARSYDALDDYQRAVLIKTLSYIVGYTPELQTITNYQKNCVYITCFMNCTRSDFLTITDGNLMTVDTLRYADQQRALNVMHNCSKFNNGELVVEEPKDFWSENYMAICAGWLAASACAFMAFY